MPRFDPAPPEGARQSGLRLIRTPAARPIVLICTSHRITGCATHWYSQRTVPCEAPGCPACDEGFPWRWHAYLSALHPVTLEHLILELTARAVDPLQAYETAHGTLRGCQFEAARVNQKPNGRVLIRTRPADLAKIRLPEPPNIERLLCHIWGLPETAVYGRGDPDGRDRIKLNKDAPSPVHVMPSTECKPPAPIPQGNNRGKIK